MSVKVTIWVETSRGQLRLQRERPTNSVREEPIAVRELFIECTETVRRFYTEGESDA